MSNFVLERPEELAPVHNQIIGISKDKSLYNVRWSNGRTTPMRVSKFWAQVDDGDIEIMDKDAKTFKRDLPDIEWQ